MIPGNYEYFISIVQCGSLTKAAEKLYISQPSLSQYLKRLESNLGVELFDHGSSPLRLTYTGERYYHHVLQLQKMDKELLKEFQDIKNDVSGRLRLGIALWRGACLLPEVFPCFHKTYPEIEVELFEGRSNQLESALLHDNIDLAIMNLPHNLNYGKLTCERIIEEPILLAAPTTHPVIQELLQNCPYHGSYPVAPLNVLNQLPLIITKPGQNLTHEINYFLGRNQLEPEILMDTGNLTTAINLTARNVACTFVPAEGAKVCSHPGKVTFFMMDDPDFHWPLAAVYKKDSYLPKIAQLFISTLRETLGSLQDEFM